jgi:co-chaperonin GroES (HSP10)
MNLKNFTPHEDRLLVKEIKKTEPEKTEAGIIIDMVKSPVVEAEVLSAGAGKYVGDDGKLAFIPTQIAKGDIVLMSAEGGLPITVNGEDCRVVRESEIIGVTGRIAVSENS